MPLSHREDLAVDLELKSIEERLADWRERAFMPQRAGMSLEHEDRGLATLRGQPD